jgi:hypothetical protein
LGLIGRVEQVDVAQGISMTAACTECCPDSWYSFWIDPGTVDGVPGDSGQFAGRQQNITCYGEILDPFQVFPGDFTSSDPSVASCNSSGFATALSPGTTNIGASWTVRFWDFDFESGGCTRYLETANPDAACNVHPGVSSISPNKTLIGEPVNVTITGTGFDVGSVVNIDGGTVQNVTLQSSTSITANYTSDDNASGGNHRVTVTTNGESSTDNVNFYVQLPTSLQVLSVDTLPTGTTGDYGCTPDRNYGISVAIHYQVLDQNGDPILREGMEPQENNSGSWDDIGPTRISYAARDTDTSGKFYDAPFSICAIGTFPTQSLPGGPQPIRIVAPNQNTYPVRTNNFTASSSAQGAGTISNGSDIQKSRP